MDTKNITFGDWNWRVQISLSQKPNFENVDIKKIKVSNKNYFGKKVLNILLVTKITKKVKLLCILLQKWVDIEKF